jgi:hypothetical protein
MSHVGLVWHGVAWRWSGDGDVQGTCLQYCMGVGCVFNKDIFFPINFWFDQ